MKLCDAHCVIACSMFSFFAVILPVKDLSEFIMVQNENTCYYYYLAFLFFTMASYKPCVVLNLYSYLQCSQCEEKCSTCRMMQKEHLCVAALLNK